MKVLYHHQYLPLSFAFLVFCFASLGFICCFSYLCGFLSFVFSFLYCLLCCFLQVELQASLVSNCHTQNHPPKTSFQFLFLLNFIYWTYCMLCMLYLPPARIIPSYLLPLHITMQFSPTVLGGKISPFFTLVALSSLGQKIKKWL